MTNPQLFIAQMLCRQRHPGYCRRLVSYHWKAVESYVASVEVWRKCLGTEKKNTCMNVWVIHKKNKIKIKNKKKNAVSAQMSANVSVFSVFVSCLNVLSPTPTPPLLSKGGQAVQFFCLCLVLCTLLHYRKEITWSEMPPYGVSWAKQWVCNWMGRWCCSIVIDKHLHMHCLFKHIGDREGLSLHLSFTSTSLFWPLKLRHSLW